MAQLAIKGHTTRGKEVIEILEMLGGKNYFQMNGFTEEFIYYICEEKDNQIHSAICPTNQIVFTIEEFLEKYPYKVWDKVQHKGATSCGSVFEVEKMRWVGNHVEYTVKRLWYHNDYSVVTAKDLQPFEEETMDKAVFDANAQCCDIMNHLIKKETMTREEQITHLLYDGGGIDQCRGIVFNLLDSGYIDTDLVFDVIENILKNNKRTIKENYITPIDRCDYFLKEGKKYACLDNDLKLCVAEKGSPEWRNVSHVMTQMDVARALEIINKSMK